MEKILVKQIGGAIIGAVSVHPDGSWLVEAQTPEQTKALHELVARITANPISFRTGRTEKTANGISEITIRKECRKGDPDYARALSDALGKETLLGVRIRGIVERR